MKDIKRGMMFRWPMRDGSKGGAVVVHEVDEDFCDVIVISTDDPALAAVTKAHGVGSVSRDYLIRLDFVGELDERITQAVVFSLFDD